MKNLLASLAIIVLLGAGCTSTPAIEKQVYTDTELGFEISYPMGWLVGTNGAPDPTLLHYVYFKPSSTKGGESINVWIYTELSSSFIQWANEPEAVIGKIGDYFYVINSDGDIAAEDFDLIVESLHSLSR